MRGNRWMALGTVALAAALGCGGATAADKDGFFLFLDAAMATPQNTDQVLAVAQGDPLAPVQTQSTIRPDWGSSFAGRLGLGWKFQGGQSLSVSYWRFNSDERTTLDGPANGFLNFSIGPAPLTVYGYYGQYGVPGSLDIKTEVKAETIDLNWGREHELAKGFVLSWSLGLRYAKFDETYSGSYDFYDVASGYTGYYTYGVAKTNESTMLGFRADTRVTRNFGTSFAVTAGLGFSFLDGDVESTSGLTPIGIGNAGFLPATLATAKDDRSGLIRDFDVGCYWRIADDHFRIGIGWEQSSWDDLPADLLRNNVGTLTVAPERKNVTFSSWKLGLYARF